MGYYTYEMTSPSYLRALYYILGLLPGTMPSLYGMTSPSYLSVEVTIILVG